MEGCPIPLTKPSRRPSTLRRSTIVASNLTDLRSAAIRLSILTGARLREILHAKWEQIDIERGLIFLADSKTGKKPLYLSAAAQETIGDVPRIEENPDVIAGAEWRHSRTSRSHGLHEPGGGLGGRRHSRPAPLVCFVRRRRVSRFADHREVARSLTASNGTGRRGLFGEELMEEPSNNFGRDGQHHRRPSRGDREASAFLIAVQTAIGMRDHPATLPSCRVAGS